MIVEHAEIAPGITAFRSFAFGLTTNAKRKPHRGFPMLKRDLETMRLSGGIAGDVRSDLQRPSTSRLTDNVDVDAAVEGAFAQPDVFAGQKKLCSLQKLAACAGVDYGTAHFAKARGSITPDVDVSGMACWDAGTSAGKAISTLKRMKK